MFPKTIFLDIDGTLLEYVENFYDAVGNSNIAAIKGSKEKCSEWHCKGYKIILTTGRPSAMRETTEQNLRNQGIIYDQLVMDCGCGPRVLINDNHPDFDNDKAVGISIVRNEGIDHIDI